MVAAGASSLILVVGTQPAAGGVPASSRKTGVLVGQVFASDGRPVADTHLCLRLFRLYHASERGFRSNGGMPRGSYVAGSLTVDSLWTQSDSNGRFQLELSVMPTDSAVREQGLPSLLLNASIWVPESGASYPCPIVIEPEKRCEIVFRLRRTGDLKGRVVDPLGSPVEGVSVTLSQDVPHWSLFKYPTMGEPWSFAATSGPDGMFRLRGLLPGDYDITAGGGSHIHVLSEHAPGHVTVEVGNTVRPEILVAPDRELRGTAVDSSGRPFRNTCLFYHAPGISGPLQTNGEGRFHLGLREDFVPFMPHGGPRSLPQSFTLWITNWRSDAPPPESGPPKLAGSLDLDFTQQLPQELLVRLDGTGIMEFDARSPTPRDSLGYINVYFLRPGELDAANLVWPWDLAERCLNVPCRGYADHPKAGVFSIDGVPCGEYEAYVWYSGAHGCRATIGGHARILVQPGSKFRTDPLDFVSMPLLTGKMTGVDSLFSGGSLELQYEALEGEAAGKQQEVNLTLQADGTYRARLPRPGRFRGLVRSGIFLSSALDEMHGGTISDVFDFDVRDGDETTRDLALHPASRLQVTLVDPARGPVAGCLVTIEPRNRVIPIAPIERPQSIYGGVESGPLPPGRYRVSVLAAGHRARITTQEVDLGAKVELRRLEIRLPPSKEYFDPGSLDPD